MHTHKHACQTHSVCFRFLARLDMIKQIFHTIRVYKQKMRSQQQWQYGLATTITFLFVCFFFAGRKWIFFITFRLLFFFVPLIWPAKTHFKCCRSRKKNVIFHRSIRHPLKMRNNFCFWFIQSVFYFFFEFRTSKRKIIFYETTEYEILAKSLVNE